MNVKITATTGTLTFPLPTISAGLAGLYLALLQSGIVSYAGADMSDAGWLARAILILYGVAAIVASVAVVNNRVEWRPLIPIAIFVAIALAPLALSRGSIGPVTKSYLISLASTSIFFVIARTPDVRRVAQFSASIICAASICCLLDVCFYDGFSNTAGRAAFIYINPNVAALALLLGAVSSGWAVPLRWLPSFVVIVGAAVFATLSRSAMLMGAMTLVACAFLPRDDHRIVLAQLRLGMKKAAIVGACSVALLAIAFVNNPAFSVASEGGFHGIITATKWIKMGNLLEHTELSHGEADVPQVSQHEIQAVEEQNSASARALLAERAWHQFLSAPVAGIGLEKAFAMAPHNSYLLLADAFGLVGWIIIPALIAALVILGGRRAVPGSVLIALAGLFSHDLLFAMPLVASIPLLFASVCRDRATSEIPGRGPRLALSIVAIAVASVCVMTDVVEQNNLPQYRVEFTGNQIGHLSGNEYYAELPMISPRGIFRLGAEGREYFRGGGIIVSEGGAQLPMAGSFPAEIRREGSGRYGFHNMWALFSSSDGSSPQFNGRTYQVTAEVVMHPLFLLCVLVSIGWAVINAFDLLSVLKLDALLAGKTRGMHRRSF
jgi:hypothetical protein